MKAYHTLYFFLFLFVSSCGNHQVETAATGDNKHGIDTIIPTSSGNQHFEPAVMLSDSVQKLLKSEKFTSKNGFDSFDVNTSDRFYNIDAGHSQFNYLLFMEGFGEGIAGRAITLSVIKNINGNYYKIQSLSAIPDSLKQTSSNGLYDVALYYPNALFDGTCPVSVTYKWNGNYYEPAELNYITSVTNVNYSSDLLSAMGIISKKEILFSFPFIKESNINKKYDINKISIDTLVSKGDKLFLFKNDCSDALYANHIWILKQVQKKYILITERDKSAATAISLVSRKNKGFPDIIFGIDTLRWTGKTYEKNF